MSAILRNFSENQKKTVHTKLYEQLTLSNQISMKFLFMVHDQWKHKKIRWKVHVGHNIKLNASRILVIDQKTIMTYNIKLIQKQIKDTDYKESLANTLKQNSNERSCLPIIFTLKIVNLFTYLFCLPLKGLNELSQL